MRASALGQRLSASVSLQQTPMWNSALMLVPPVVLLGAGYLFARRQSDDGAPSALACGVRIALGYGATAAGGVYLVGYSRSAAIAAITLQPAVGTAAPYCGGYALAFGTGGALLYSTYGHSGRAPSEPKSRH